jgi:hypothetical protein
MMAVRIESRMVEQGSDLGADLDQKINFGQRQADEEQDE